MTATVPPHQMTQTTTSRGYLWAGRIMSAIVVIALAVDGLTLLFAPEKLAGPMEHTGFAIDLAHVLGPIALVSIILYAIPSTAVLGAILVTAFWGGAICAHVRIGELASPPALIALLLGILTWGGLYARDARIRALLPFIR